MPLFLFVNTHLKRRSQVYLVTFSTLATSATTLLYLKYIQYIFGAEYIGLLALLISALSFIRLIDFGISPSCLVEFAKLKNKGNRKISVYISAIFIIFLALLFLVLPICLAFSSQVIGTAKIPSSMDDVNIHRLVLIQALAITFSVLNQILSSVLDGLGEVKVRSLVISISTTLAIPLFLYKISTSGIIGYSYALTAQNAIVLVIFVLYLRISRNFVFTTSNVKIAIFRFLKIGKNMTLVGMPPLFFEQFVKIGLSLYSNLDIIGYYEIISQFFARIKLIVVSVVSSYVSQLSTLIYNRALNHDKIINSIQLKNNQFRVRVLQINLLAIVSSPLYLSFFGVDLSPIVILVTLAFGLAWIFNNYFTINYFCFLIIKDFRTLHKFNLALYLITAICGFYLHIYPGYYIIIAVAIGTAISSLALNDSVLRRSLSKLTP